MIDLSWMSQPFAHRGLHGGASGNIENTRSAFVAAMEYGFGFETDLRQAREGTIMVFHDKTVDRLTQDSGDVSMFTQQQLQNLSFKNSADQMMSLGELLALVKGKVPILLELKSDGADRPESQENFIRRLIDELHGYQGPFAVMSFDPALISLLAERAPHMPRGLVSQGFDHAASWPFLSLRQRLSLRNLLSFPQTRPHFIAYDIKALPALAPLLARSLFKRPLLCWTVRTKGQRKRAQKYCDGMIFEGFLPSAPDTMQARSV